MGSGTNTPCPIVQYFTICFTSSEDGIEYILRFCKVFNVQSTSYGVTGLSRHLAIRALSFIYADWCMTFNATWYQKI